jgi:hypothetical protein
VLVDRVRGRRCPRSIGGGAWHWTWSASVHEAVERGPSRSPSLLCFRFIGPTRGGARAQMMPPSSRASRIQAPGLLLAPRSHYEALAFLIRQPDPLHRGSLGRLLVWCLDTSRRTQGAFLPGLRPASNGAWGERACSLGLMSGPQNAARLLPFRRLGAHLRGRSES